MFEHKEQPLLSRKAFARRMSHFGISAFLLIALSLLLGILGYRYFEGLDWIDSILNASMILGGMGPVNPLHSVSGKLFASFYALFSGVVFLFSVGILLAPLLHRFMHRFHLESTEHDKV